MFDLLLLLGKIPKIIKPLLRADEVRAGSLPRPTTRFSCDGENGGQFVNDQLQMLVNAGWIVYRHACPAQMLVRPSVSRLTRCWLILTGHVSCDEYQTTDGFKIAAPMRSHAGPR